MSECKLGCQTITWGPQQRDHFPRVFEEVAAGRFTGVEIGFRHIQPIAPTELGRMLGSAGLTLLGSHIGGNLEDTDQAAGERNVLEQVLDYLQEAQCNRLMYSGLKFENDAQFERDLAMIQHAHQRCDERGVHLLYHNHNWEFADGGRVINALIDRTDIGFCPDIGWVMRGGADVIALLDRIKARIGAIHFKDFGTVSGDAAGGQVDTVMLGQGVAPLAQAAKWALHNVPQVWMIAEQDKADRPTAGVAKVNGEYLRKLFDGP